MSRLTKNNYDWRSPKDRQLNCKQVRKLEQDQALPRLGQSRPARPAYLTPTMPNGRAVSLNMPSWLLVPRTCLISYIGLSPTRIVSHTGLALTCTVSHTGLALTCTVSRTSLVPTCDFSRISLAPCAQPLAHKPSDQHAQVDLPARHSPSNRASCTS